jgi:membrane-associated protease RseP (regulator of RpoE activity)
MELDNQPSDIFTPLISKHFEIKSITWGTTEQDFIIRYQGEFTSETESAYEALDSTFSLRNYATFFLIEENVPTIKIKTKRIVKPSGKSRTNILLFIFTLISMMFSGALYSSTGELTTNGSATILAIFSFFSSGAPFAISMLAILTAHEFGHFFAAKYHKSDVSLPYFIPFPFSPFGTLGAFIQLKSHPKNRKILHDIGVAGPLAGLVFTIPILFFGLSLSSLNYLPTAVAEGLSISLEGNSIFYLFSKYIMFGEWLPAPHVAEINAGFLYWVKYIITGMPVPFGGLDVYLHPIAWAGWAGLLITSLNLIPVGQLDGGHILYVLLGDKAKKVVPYVLGMLFSLGFYWQGWWLWFVIIWFTGRSHAQPYDQITPLDNTRKCIAIFMMIVFVLLFMPIPLNIISSPIS